jgi:hypothetical protein
VLRGKGAAQWVNDDLTKGQARSREAWIGKVIGLFQELEQCIGDGADHVLARKQRGIGKECWEVGWELEDGHTDRAFGAALTKRNAARLVLDVNTIIDRFVEQRAVDAALAELANWHGRTTWLTSGGSSAQARELAEIRRIIEGCLRKINAA